MVLVGVVGVGRIEEWGDENLLSLILLCRFLFSHFRCPRAPRRVVVDRVVDNLVHDKVGASKAVASYLHVRSVEYV